MHHHRACHAEPGDAKADGTRISVIVGRASGHCTINFRPLFLSEPTFAAIPGKP
jgi:hypothetical protein